ncbi:hypothetical protein [Nocardioides plantarum]|uniref:Uncharacterized protein n=1 Tax=Nocardioides plantarum TaxID=29299 RepID=A0ABV5KC23_9ACTN|nr:hypothetical protein [Nocardioides plantarum]
MKKILLLPVLMLLSALLALGLARPGAADAARPGASTTDGAGRDARPVIVQVEGTAADGFTLRYADGSSISPPTDSEAAAECAEYDTAVARLRCRVEVRTWYRDLGDLKRSLAWVRAHG